MVPNYTQDVAISIWVFDLQSNIGVRVCTHRKRQRAHARFVASCAYTLLEARPPEACYPSPGSTGGWPPCWRSSWTPPAPGSLWAGRPPPGRTSAGRWRSRCCSRASRRPACCCGSTGRPGPPARAGPRPCWRSTRTRSPCCHLPKIKSIKSTVALREGAFLLQKIN